MKGRTLAIFFAVFCVYQIIAVDQKEEPKPHPECPTGPSEDVTRPVHISYPGDCKKFYKCLKGLAYPHNCPGDLYWSYNNISCLYAGQESPPCISTLFNPQKIIAVVQKEEPKPHPECPTGPSEDVTHPVHISHPRDCKKFYKCLKGSAYPFDCPGDLYWSYNNISCLYAGQESPPCQY